MASMSVKAAKALFRKYDLDHEGWISREDLEKIVEIVCPGTSKAEFNDIVKAIDKNRDNKIQYEEFVEFLFLDPVEGKKKVRPGRSISKSQIEVLFDFWQEVLHETSPGKLMEKQVLLNILGLSRRSSEMLAVIAKHEEAEAERGGRSREERGREAYRVIDRLLEKEFADDVESDLPETFTKQAFIRAVWPKISDSDAGFAFAYMERLLAQSNMAQIAEAALRDKPLHLKVQDLDWTFDHIDGDKDECLSVKEVVKAGGLSLQDALDLSEALDKVSKDGTIVLKELMTVACAHMNNDFSATLRTVFATRCDSSFSVGSKDKQ